MADSIGFPTDRRIAVIGAGGKMGSRIRRNLDALDNEVYLVEASGDRRREIEQDGHAALADFGSAADADVVIMAIPDRAIAAASQELVPQMKSGATMILLDPAAAYVGVLAKRDDCTFVVTHPCHPPLFMEQESAEAKADMFGGVAAEQDIVIALDGGSEERFEEAEALCRTMFAPVMDVHRISVRDMAILEPAAAEVVVACAATLMREALDEAVRRGVPETAARSFLLGHTRIPLAIAFGETDFPFSDAAQTAIGVGFQHVIRPDWKRVYDEDVLRETIRRMIGVDEG